MTIRLEEFLKNPPPLHPWAMNHWNDSRNCCCKAILKYCVSSLCISDVLTASFLCDNEAAQVSLTSSCFFLLFLFCFLKKDVLKSVMETCVQSVSGSFCMHHSGFVSYDCKNESSKPPIKIFHFYRPDCVVVVTAIIILPPRFFLAPLNYHNLQLISDMMACIFTNSYLWYLKYSTFSRFYVKMNGTNFKSFNSLNFIYKALLKTAAADT